MFKHENDPEFAHYNILLYVMYNVFESSQRYMWSLNYSHTLDVDVNRCINIFMNSKPSGHCDRCSALFNRFVAWASFAKDISDFAYFL
jgi:hypothetical protein